MKEAPPDEEEEVRAMRRKKGLLERYEIPVEHLDFRYIEKCKDAKEVERIVKVLRSGEEGFFPDLEKCAVNRLEKLNPKSRLLRVELPILRSDCLKDEELNELKRNFLDWVDKIETENELEAMESEDSPEIFSDLPPVSQVPIRSLDKKSKPKSSSSDFARSSNPNRIKSWEYDKWDKFDVDAELTKLDVESMQIEEWERSVDKKKLKEEQELVAKLMKNEDLKERKSKSVFSTTASSPTQGKKKAPAAVVNVVKSEDVPELEDAELIDVHSQQSPVNESSRTVKKNSVGSGSKQTAEALLDVPASGSPKIRSIANIIPSGGTLGPSFIEELTDDDNVKSLKIPKSGRPVIEERPQKAKQQQSKQPIKPVIEELPTNSARQTDASKPKSRFRIHIEDLNVG